MRSMIGSPAEEPLSGGRTRDGVVRIGTTVRRPLTAGSPYVHAVLRRDEYVDGQPPRSGADLHGELLAGLRRQQARILDFRAQQHDDFSAAKHSEIMAAMAWVDHNRKTLITSLLRRR